MFTKREWGEVELQAVGALEIPCKRAVLAPDINNTTSVLHADREQNHCYSA